MRLLLPLLLHTAAVAAPMCAISPTHLSVENQQLGDFVHPATDLAVVTDRPAPWLSWWLSAPPQTANQSQSAYRIQVATSPAGFAVCDAGGGPACIWDSGAVASGAQGVAYGGAVLPAMSAVVWRVSVWDGAGAPCGPGAEVGAWEVPLLSESDWRGAAWLTRDAPHPPLSDCEQYQPNPAPLFRAPLDLPPGAAVVRARAWVTGLGYYTLHVDGVRVGDAALDPGVTSYNETVLYSTYDLTGVLAAQGGASHAVGVAVGNGWFNLLPLRMWGSKEFRLAVATGDPMFRLLVRVQLDAGPDVWLASALDGGAQWAVGASEVLRNSVYLGAEADGRLRPGNWSAPGFNATGWPAPFPASTPVGTLRAQAVPPVRRQAALAVTTHVAGPALVLDAGRNIAGVCEFCMAGPPGTTLTFRYGELLFPNGSVNGWTSVAGQIKGPGVGGPCAPDIAWQEDTYTLRGDAGGECWAPPFTWHGFRFVEVTGNYTVLDASRTQCFPMRSDVAQTSRFSSSSDLLNRIHEMAVNTEACNMMSLQSDCPHRERLGYGGDALMTGESFIYNFDVAAFYAKRVRDYADAQRANGGFTETSPYVGISDAGMGGNSGPIGWQSFMPIMQAWLLTYYGSVGVLEDTYASALAYCAFLDAAPASAIENGLGDWMDIERPALSLTGRGFQAMSYAAFANVSAALGHADVAAQYAAAAANISALINTRFLSPATGVYSDPVQGWNATQCGQALPLFLGIVPPASEADAVAILRDNIAEHGGHLQVGGFGMKWLLTALSDAGLSDAAFGIMNQTDFPSFGYMLDGSVNGIANATTIWESWFTSTDTYSHNHPMFSSADIWVFNSLGGIRPKTGAVAFDGVVIRPLPPSTGLLSWVNATIETVRGPVSSAWTLSGDGSFALTTATPPNMDVEVVLPDGSRHYPGSGTHTFSCTIPAASL